MIKKTLGSLLATFVLASTHLADAQQPKKVPRVGYLHSSGSAASPSPTLEIFRHALRDLGYVEGKNIVIDYRGAEGKLDRLPDLAAELVRLKVDVIVTPSTPVALAAKDATKTIPIVAVAVSDPVVTGLVLSLARPGGNVTGLTIFASELSGKRLELLRESVPRVSRVAILRNPANPYVSHRS